jgi:hypothetical protein
MIGKTFGMVVLPQWVDQVQWDAAAAGHQLDKLEKQWDGFRGPTLSLTLAQMILDGSKYCEALETRVAFHVFSGTKDAKKTNLSTGRKLYELSLKCAPVALPW